MTMKGLASILLMALLAPAALAFQNAPATDSQGKPAGLTEQRRLNQRFVELFRERRYAEGEELAESLLRRAEENYGYDSNELLGPLINLATVQRVQGQYSDALYNYQRHISIVERKLGYDSLELINPLHGTARTHIRMGDYEAAIEPLARALRVTHSNTGIYSLEQGATRDLLSDVSLGEGDLEQANLHQRVQVRAHERRYGAGDVRMVPSLYKLGEWYERTRQTGLQRRAYEAADRIIQSASGEDSLERIQALRGQASSFLKESRREKAEEFFRQALSIVRAHPGQDILQQARLLIDIGDTLTIFNRQPRAQENYREAWELLSEDDDALDARAELLQHPVIPLRSARLPVQVPRDVSESSRYEPQPRAGSVTLQLTIEADGTVSGAEVMESDPPAMIDDIVVALIKGAKFRPQMRDGEPVRVEDVIYRHRFRWYKQREPESGEDLSVPSEPVDEERPLEVPGAAESAAEPPAAY